LSRVRAQRRPASFHPALIPHRKQPPRAAGTRKSPQGR
jgi:hypothetical protein